MCVRLTRKLYDHRHSLFKLSINCHFKDKKTRQRISFRLDLTSGSCSICQLHIHFLLFVHFESCLTWNHWKFLKLERRSWKPSSNEAEIPHHFDLFCLNSNLYEMYYWIFVSYWSLVRIQTNHREFH